MMNPRCRRPATSRAVRGCPFGHINGRSMPRIEAQNHSPTVQEPLSKTAPAVHPTLDPQSGVDTCAEICKERHRKTGVRLSAGAWTCWARARDARAYFAMAARDERQAPNACQNAVLGDSGANSQFMWA